MTLLQRFTHAVFATVVLAVPGWALAVQCNFACPDIVRTGTLPTIIPGIFVGSNSWFDPAYNGQGWSFSELVGAVGTPPIGLGVTYTYEIDGRPTWLLLQGNWVRETRVGRLVRGEPIAVLSGPVFDGEGGACPTCPFMPPTIAQRRYLNARVAFNRPDVATVELDGRLALSGTGALVPSETIVTRPLSNLLAGTWRYTVRNQLIGAANYNERNFDQHGCELIIASVPSPTVENRFDASPTSPPFWLPPSGAQVQWLSVSSITCQQEEFSSRYVIALEPASRAPLRAISLSSLTATPEPGTGRVLSYTVSAGSRFLQVFVQGPDRLIVRLHGNDPAINNAENVSITRELELTRAP